MIISEQHSGLLSEFNHSSFFSVVPGAKLKCIFRLLNSLLLPCKFQNQTTCTDSPYMYLLATFLFILVLEICYSEMRC